MKKELLAPAGDIEAGYAALYYGADAVYLGLKQFSARATAANFSETDLSEFVDFAHSLGRKVFVAVNTLVQENELDDLLKTLDLCSKYMVDAVIIQDFGVARIVKEQYPELEMHASTQMAVHNKEGALALQKAGFSRVVVARELTLAEIKEIAAIPGLETEAFIHGALCYSYSGLCLFSSIETGKSANRGKCLYPCRAAFCGEEGEKHYFSMKDMALQAEAAHMPVTSLKIEGRKKTALYVAAVTDYYRRILDGKGDDSVRAENIRQIFSRPWTKFHFRGKNKDVIDRNFVGHRGLEIGRIEQAGQNRISFRTSHKIARYDGIQIDIPGQEKPFGFSLQTLRVNGKNEFDADIGEVVDVFLPPKAPKLEKGLPIYLASSSEVKGAYPYIKPKPGEYKLRQPVSVSVEVYEDKIWASDGKVCSEVKGCFERANNHEKTENAIKDAFAKTGDTALRLAKIEIFNPNGLFVPVSMLNELRRDLYVQIKVENKHGLLPELSAPVNKNKPGWIIKTDDISCLEKIDLAEADEIIFLLSQDTSPDVLKKIPKNKLRLALPAVCRRPEGFNQRIENLLAQGYKKWEIGNYWGLRALPEKGIDLSFDSSIYMMNSQAAEMAKKTGASRITLAVEDLSGNMQKVAEKSPLATVLTVYQDVPLFTSADCIRSNACKDCSREEKWIRMERNGVVYEVLSKDCQVMLFGKNAFCAAADAEKIGVNFYRVDFCYKKYSAGKALSVWNSVRKFEDVADTVKGNLGRPALL